MLSYFVFRTLDSSVFDTKTCPCWDSWVLATTHPVFFPPPLWLSLRGVLGTHVDTPACMSRFWPHPKQSPPVLSQVSLGQVHTRANVCPREGRPDGQALEEDLGLCKQGISATWRIIWEVGWGTMGPGPGEGTAGGQNEVRSWALLLGFMHVSSSGYLRCLILIQARILLPLDS